MVTVPYIIFFSGPLSGEQQNWAQFGDYVGGTLSPLLAALALIALLYTLRQQQEQINQLRKQAVKEDLLRAIEKLEEDFEKSLSRFPIRLPLPKRTLEFSGWDVVFSPSFIEYKEAMVNEADIMAIINAAGGVNAPVGFQRDDPKIHAYEMFGLAAGHLNQIRIYANNLDQASGNNALSKYYQRKYKVPYDRFLERGFVKEPWDEPA